MKNEILLGIDIGTKRVGIAISHGFMAEGLKTLDYTDQKKFYDEIGKIIAEQKIEKIIVGLPIHNNAETAQTKWTREQAGLLKEKFNLPVEFTDEAYSSVEADKFEADRDSESARIILEQYLNS